MAAAFFKLLTTLLLTLVIAISAKPVLERKSPMKLALTKRSIIANYNVMEHDLRRVKRLAGNQVRDDSDLGGTDASASFQTMTYTVELDVGSPSTTYTLLVDTGSSNTWLGATINHPYVQTSTSQPTGKQLVSELDFVSMRYLCATVESESLNQQFVTYGSGSVSGYEFIDQVSVAKDLVTNQSIGFGNLGISGFNGYDGVLGVGPVGLTNGTLPSDPQALIPTITDSLFATGAISEHLMAVFFHPFSNSGNNGEIRWGDVDSSKFLGAITFTPITSTPPSNKYWGIDATVVYGSEILLNSAAGIVDSGTTLILLASTAFQAYVNATGAVLDTTTRYGLPSIPTSQFGQMQNLNFFVEDTEFTLNPDAQIWPPSLNAHIGGIVSRYYLIVHDMGNLPFDFVFGMVAMERFYTVFDTGNNQVGLAYTPFTLGTFNTA